MSARTSGFSLQPMKKQNQLHFKFPYKLWHLLNECTDGAIRWSETGDYFAVDQARFLNSLDVVKHFQTIKFSSFIRQLNMYGFRKFFPNNHKQGRCTCECHQTSPVGYYRHEFFRRGDIDCLNQVTRQRRQSGVVTNGNDSYADIPLIEPLVEVNYDTKDFGQLEWGYVRTIPNESLETPMDPNLNHNSLANFPEQNFSYSCFQDNTRPFTENTDVDIDWNTVPTGDSTIKVELDDESRESEIKWTGVNCSNKKIDPRINLTEISPLSSDRRQFVFQPIDSEATNQPIDLFQVDVLLSIIHCEAPMDFDVEI